jgi:predicted GNAT superfamily acetyltransferase
MPVSPPSHDLIAERAAAAAADHAGVRVCELDDLSAVRQAAALLADVWQTKPSLTPINSDLMRALQRAGNYVAGAYHLDTLVGVSVAFFTGDAQPQLHSHIAGIAPALQGRSVGFALKLHQRAWALARGVEHVSWTVDPLVSRNAFFNLVKLRADAIAYLPDFYGPMEDGVNGGDESDRLLVSWQLRSERVIAACEIGHAVESAAPDGAPVPVLLDLGADGGPLIGDVGGAARFTCRLPADAVRLRATDPRLGRAWRAALRDTLGRALHDGCRVAGFSRAGGYLLSREPTS